MTALEGTREAYMEDSDVTSLFTLPISRIGLDLRCTMRGWGMGVPV